MGPARRRLQLSTCARRYERELLSPCGRAVSLLDARADPSLAPTHAQTGSGKTAAFCFPIIASMLFNNYQPQIRNARKATPFALILAPTRELTSQIYDEARKFTFQTGIRPVVIYGGAPVPNQVRRAARSRPSGSALGVWGPSGTASGAPPQHAPPRRPGSPGQVGRQARHV